MLVSEKGVIVRTSADLISQQSRAATGVRLQRLDSGDHLAEIVLVPPQQDQQESSEDSSKSNNDVEVDNLSKD